MVKDKVGLIIGTYNRTNLLAGSLKRLCNLTIPDVITVVDDGGNDNCEAICNSFKDRLPINYIYNHNPEWTISSFSKNIGIKNTDCQVAIYSEPEVLFITDVVKQMVELHERFPKTVISAGTIYHGGEFSQLYPEMITHTEEFFKEHPFVNESRDNPNPILNEGWSKIQGWVASFCALYRKEWIMNINGWDESFIHYNFDDTDMLSRLRANGIGQRISLEIECVHQWHSKLDPSIQYEGTLYNEKAMMDKNLDKGGKNNPEIQANKGKEWGIIKQRI